MPKTKYLNGACRFSGATNNYLLPSVLDIPPNNHDDIKAHICRAIDTLNKKAAKAPDDKPLFPEANTPIAATDAPQLQVLMSGKAFETMDAAAIDALHAIYQQHPNDTKEWAGTFYRDHNNQYLASAPKRSKYDDQSKPSYPPYPYSIMDVIGIYHSHGQCTAKIAEDDFSRSKDENDPRSDVWQADLRRYPSYLGTPGGFIKRYDYDPKRPLNGPVTTLQTGTHCPGEHD